VCVSEHECVHVRRSTPGGSEHVRQPATLPRMLGRQQVASHVPRWPFRRERVLGRFGAFAVAGYLACMLPVYHATKWVCAVS